MSEHERLKEICKIINFNITNSELDIHHSSLLPYFHKEPMFCRYYNGERNKINTKDIIFTKEFMDTLFNWSRDMATQIDIYSLLHHLDNPIDYLYKILGLNTK